MFLQNYAGVLFFYMRLEEIAEMFFTNMLVEDF